MSGDYMLWLERQIEAQEKYDLDGLTPPPGHRDEWLDEQEQADHQGRYYDAPLRAPVRVSDDWELDEDLDVAA